MFFKDSQARSKFLYKPTDKFCQKQDPCEGNRIAEAPNAFNLPTAHPAHKFGHLDDAGSSLHLLALSPFDELCHWVTRGITLFLCWAHVLQLLVE